MTFPRHPHERCALQVHRGSPAGGEGEEGMSHEGLSRQRVWQENTVGWKLVPRSRETAQSKQLCKEACAWPQCCPHVKSWQQGNGRCSLVFLSLCALGPNAKPTDVNGEALRDQLLKMCSAGAAKEQSKQQAQV